MLCLGKVLERFVVAVVVKPFCRRGQSGRLHPDRYAETPCINHMLSSTCLPLELVFTLCGEKIAESDVLYSYTFSENCGKFSIHYDTYPSIASHPISSSTFLLLLLLLLAPQTLSLQTYPTLDCLTVVRTYVVRPSSPLSHPRPTENCRSSLSRASLSPPPRAFERSS